MDCIVIAKQTAYLKALGYCELSVQSLNMLSSLLTAADFLYHFSLPPVLRIWQLTPPPLTHPS